MRNKAAWAALLVAPLLALAGCATGPSVRTLADPSANFSQYRSFGFIEPLGTDTAGYQSLVSGHLKEATRRTLEARGLRFDPVNPQLLINFNGTLDDRLRVTTVPEPVPPFGYYGYRRGFYNPWPMYRERTEVREYQQGTLTIDVVDAARKQLIWEGTVSKSVTSADLDNLAAAINRGVEAGLAKFPAGRLASH